MKNDMTVGVEWKKIVLFSLPIMIGNLLQQLYNTVDGIVVGNFVGENALAATGSCGTLAFVFLAFAIGMGNGEGMKAWATEYAIRVTGSYVFSVGTGAQSPYWVAEQSTTDARHGRFTNYKGRLGHIISDRENISPRPALYLDMHSFAIAGGTGTKVDPYVLVRGAAQ